MVKNPPASFSIKAWRVCPFQKITNDLYGQGRRVCLGGGASCQQIGVILAGGGD